MTLTEALFDFLMARFAEEEDADPSNSRTTPSMLEREAKRGAALNAYYLAAQSLTLEVPPDSMRRLGAEYADRPDYREEWKV